MNRAIEHDSRLKNRITLTQLLKENINMYLIIKPFMTLMNSL